jgi:hypothetical protein
MIPVMLHLDAVLAWHITTYQAETGVALSVHRDLRLASAGAGTTRA